MLPDRIGVQPNLFGQGVHPERSVGVIEQAEEVASVGICKGAIGQSASPADRMSAHSNSRFICPKTYKLDREFQ
jgi:hypothetical protein